MEYELRTYFNLDKYQKIADAIETKRKYLKDKIKNSVDSNVAYITNKELEFLNKKYDEFLLTEKKLNEFKNNFKTTLQEIQDIHRSSKITKTDMIEIQKKFDSIINSLTPFAGEYKLKEFIEDKIGTNNYFIEYANQVIGDKKSEINLLTEHREDLIAKINQTFNSKIDNFNDAILFIGNVLINKKTYLPKDVEFAREAITVLNENKKAIDEQIKILNATEKDLKFRKGLERTIRVPKLRKLKQFSFETRSVMNLMPNRKDWNKIVDNHSEKARQITKEDVTVDRLLKDSNIIFEHFMNSYETIYKTRDLSSHSRRASYGLSANEYGGTQFAGPINSTPLQYFGTLARTGSVGWFSSSLFSIVYADVNKIYEKRFPVNYLLSDVPLITSPMGTSSSMSIKKFFSMYFNMKNERYGEYLAPLPGGMPPTKLNLIFSLFSKNIRGERRLSEFLDMLWGNYRGTPRGARDVYNYIAFEPNEHAMDFKDKIYTLKKSRSVKKSAEHLYDVGFYAPFTNNKFIAGREITVFNDVYYTMSTSQTFYPNRAMNLLSSAPHFSNPKYRNMAYQNIYKLVQTQTEMVEESIGLSSIKDKIQWHPLIISALPYLATSGLPFLISSLALGFLSYNYSTAYNTLKFANIKPIKGLDYMERKVDSYYKRGIYSSIYNTSGEEQK